MLRGLFSITGLLVALALFFLVNAVGWSTLRPVRADLTEDALYTLSDGTKEILAGLEDPITLRFFYSRAVGKDIPAYHSHAQRVRELLQEYDARSAKLRLEVVEPEPLSEEEELAQSFGLEGPPANEDGDRLFFGLVGTNSVDDEEVIPFFAPQRQELLEYDLTQLVDNLANLGPKRKVGVISSLPMMGGAFNPMNPQAPPPPAWAVVDVIRAAGFELEELDAGSIDSIAPEDFAVLMLVHPKGLADTALFAIDQYVLGGGKVVAFVDPLAQAEQAPPGQNPMMVQRDSDLPRLFEAWGLELVASKVAGDLNNRASLVRGMQRFQVDNPLLIGVSGDSLNGDDLVTSPLDSVVTAFAGVLQPLADATTTFQPLLSTSEESMEYDAFGVAMMGEEQLLQDFVAGGAPLAVAARISGPIRTAFPGGKPVAEEESAEDATEEPATEEDGAEESWLSEGSLNAIVVADADLLLNELWTNVLGFGLMQPFNDNGDFVVNAIDNLSGSEALISLRSRGSGNRPYVRKQKIEREAEARFDSRIQELQARLDSIDRELTDSAVETEGGTLVVTADQLAERNERLREEQLKTNRELRAVRRDARKEIESLGTTLTLTNMFAVPAGLLIAALLVAFRNNRR